MDKYKFGHKPTRVKDLYNIIEGKPKYGWKYYIGTAILVAIAGTVLSFWIYEAFVIGDENTRTGLIFGLIVGIIWLACNLRGDF